MRIILAHWRHWAPACALFGLTAAFAITFHYPVLYFDHWDLAPYYQRMMAGGLEWRDLFAPHGTHWHTGGYAVMLALAPLTGMTQTPEIIASLLFALAACGGVYALLDRPGPVLFAVAALFLFSLDQAENWLWGWQISVFINIAGAAWAIALLVRGGGAASMAGAMLAAAIAVYSFATGLALLPVGLLVIWQSRRARWRMAAWAVFSAALAIHYKLAVLDTQAAYAAEITPAALDAKTIASLASYALNLLGAAVGRFSDGVPLALALLGLLGLSLTLPRNSNDPRAAGALGLLAYGAGAALLIAFGRLGFENALVSRYISFANLFWIGLAALLLRAADSPFRQRFAVIALCVLVACKIGTIGNVVSGSSAGIPHALAVQRAAAEICATYPSVSRDALAAISAPHQTVSTQLEFIAQNRLSVFRNCAQTVR